MKMLHTRLALFSALGALFATTPALANHPSVSPDLGTPVHEASVDRRIMLDADATSVNVTGGETVEFVVDGQRFAWRFDTYSSEPVFDLERIAPAGVLGDRSVKVYVAADPTYISG
jgi:hypothetical protein